jgi:hypothetical protein
MSALGKEVFKKMLNEQNVPNQEIITMPGTLEESEALKAYLNGNAATQGMRVEYNDNKQEITLHKGRDLKESLRQFAKDPPIER